MTSRPTDPASATPSITATHPIAKSPSPNSIQAKSEAPTARGRPAQIATQPPGGGPAVPSRADPGLVVIARAIHNHAVRVDYRAEITGRVADINIFRRRGIDLHVRYVMHGAKSLGWCK